jgi:hypothetical protein
MKKILSILFTLTLVFQLFASEFAKKPISSMRLNRMYRPPTGHRFVGNQSLVFSSFLTFGNTYFTYHNLKQLNETNPYLQYSNFAMAMGSCQLIYGSNFYNYEYGRNRYYLKNYKRNSMSDIYFHLGLVNQILGYTSTILALNNQYKHQAIFYEGVNLARAKKNLIITAFALPVFSFNLYRPTTEKEHLIRFGKTEHKPLKEKIIIASGMLLGTIILVNGLDEMQHSDSKNLAKNSLAFGATTLTLASVNLLQFIKIHKNNEDEEPTK